MDQKIQKYGRPRLLTHDGILDAAVEIGLEGLTVKKLAAHLGVGAATLYQYFENREELLQAAAIHALAAIKLPEDKGQHWSLLASDYAIAIQDILVENPSYIISHQYSDYGYDIRFQLIEPFLASMKTRDISPKMGMRVFNIVTMACFAGAVEAVRSAGVGAPPFFTHPTPNIAGNVTASREPDEEKYPLTYAAKDVFAQNPREKMRYMLFCAFSSIGAEIGDPPPPEAFSDQLGRR